MQYLKYGKSWTLVGHINMRALVCSTDVVEMEMDDGDEVMVRYWTLNTVAIILNTETVSNFVLLFLSFRATNN